MQRRHPHRSTKYTWVRKIIRGCSQKVPGSPDPNPWIYLGRLFDRVDLIKPVSISVRELVRPSVHKTFPRFQWKLARSWRSMSDARRYAVWPDPRSRSRLRALQIWKSVHFQKLSSPPFTKGAGNWPRILKLRHNIYFFGPNFLYLF